MTTTEDLVALLAPPHEPGSFYQRVLDSDRYPVPGVLHESSPLEDGPVEVPVQRYLAREFHDLEDEIPAVGDTLVYDVADLSFVVVRVSPTVIRAYPNACLHRGRKLVDSAA